MRDNKIPEGPSGKSKKISRRKIRIILGILYGIIVFARLGFLLRESRMLEADIGQMCRIEGEIIWQRAGQFGYEYYLKANEIQIEDKTVKTHLKFQFYSQDKIQLHSLVKVMGTLSLFSDPKNPGEWNKKHYYYGKNIYYFIRKAEVEILEAGTLRPPERFKNWVDAQSAKYLPAEERGLFLSLFAGDRNHLSQELEEDFRKIGVSHVLALSGLHIGLLVWFFGSILKRLPLAFPEQFIIIVLLLIFYLLFTGGQPSIVRAVLMYIFLEASFFRNRERNAKKAFLVTLAIFLAVNPFSVLDVGFILSFATVGAILYLHPLLLKDRPMYLQAVGITLTAQIVLLPIFSLYFHRFSLVAVIANLWVVPAISYFLGVSGIALAVSGISVSLAQIIAGSGYYLAKLIVLFAEKLSQFTLADVPIRAMKGWEILLFYGILGAVLWTKKTKYLWALLFAIVIFLPYAWSPQLSMLDVGQAESMVIEYRNHNLVIDAGLESNRSTASYLAYRGKESIDMVLLSHLDKDHAGGLKHLLANCKVGSIGISANYAELTEEIAEQYNLQGTWKNYRNLLAEAEKYQVPILYWQAGDRIQIDDLQISFLYPAAKEIPFKANDFSFVAEMEYGQTQILFTGDIGREVENLLLQRQKLRDVEVLKVAHHGSKYATQESFLQITDPELAIISCGRYNRYGHPSPDLIRTLEERGTLTRVTAESGAIFMELTKNGEVILNE